MTLVRILLVAALGLVSCTGPALDAPAESGITPTAGGTGVESLDESDARLRADFDRARTKARLLVVLSPT